MTKADGFYAGYFTSKQDSGLGLLVLQDGVLTGVDAGGVKFDGTYHIETESGSIEGEVTVDAPPGGTLIQGVPTGASGLTYRTRFKFPVDLTSQPFLRLDTPFGPVNVKLQKLRGLTQRLFRAVSARSSGGSRSIFECCSDLVCCNCSVARTKVCGQAR
ncbi:MAG: hypothetical protein H0T75_23175 [Rhizobiales bacterium]|nr:hypothetical protein [Hyphomicrobiales bacterium]